MRVEEGKQGFGFYKINIFVGLRVSSAGSARNFNQLKKNIPILSTVGLKYPSYFFSTLVLSHFGFKILKIGKFTHTHINNFYYLQKYPQYLISPNGHLPFHLTQSDFTSIPPSYSLPLQSYVRVRLLLPHGRRLQAASTPSSFFAMASPKSLILLLQIILLLLLIDI